MNHQNSVPTQKKSIELLIDQIKTVNETNFKNRCVLSNLINRLSLADPHPVIKEETAVQYQEGYIGEMQQLTDEALATANKISSLLSEIEKHI